MTTSSRKSPWPFKRCRVVIVTHSLSNDINPPCTYILYISHHLRISSAHFLHVYTVYNLSWLLRPPLSSLPIRFETYLDSSDFTHFWNNIVSLNFKASLCLLVVFDRKQCWSDWEKIVSSKSTLVWDFADLTRTKHDFWRSKEQQTISTEPFSF